MSKTQQEIDLFFIQEIIDDLEQNGYSRNGKAKTMLDDWSRELAEKSDTKRRTKRSFKLKVGWKSN